MVAAERPFQSAAAAHPAAPGTMGSAQKCSAILSRRAHSNYLNLEPRLLLEDLFFCSDTNKEPNCMEAAETAL